MLMESGELKPHSYTLLTQSASRSKSTDVPVFANLLFELSGTIQILRVPVTVCQLHLLLVMMCTHTPLVTVAALYGPLRMIRMHPIFVNKKSTTCLLILVVVSFPNKYE